jgi:hypothetical protein
LSFVRIFQFPPDFIFGGFVEQGVKPLGRLGGRAVFDVRVVVRGKVFSIVAVAVALALMMVFVFVLCCRVGERIAV